MFGSMLAHAAPAWPRGWKEAALATKTNCVGGTTDVRVAQADFDGDGAEDTARLLQKTNGTGFGVWVWLAQKPDPALVVSIDETARNPDIVIDVVQPGTRSTACGNGYWQCAPNEPAKLVLRSAAINVLFCERSDQIAYWHPKSKGFRTVWMSD